MKRIAILILILTSSLTVYAQKDKAKDTCPPGWERQPEKHPECYGTVLPVTVKSFTAENNLKGIVLSWSVGQEVNHSHYIIERSADGFNFDILDSTREYQLTDKHPMEDNYYRLVSIDLDGTRNVYRIIYIRSEPQKYAVYNASGKYLGEFKSLSDIPKNQLVIVNRVKTILN